jgi:F-type H+-transporting ATPase subunit a
MALHISIAAEKITNIAGFPITNSLLLTWVVMAFLFIVGFLLTRKFKKVPTYPQLMVELTIGGLYDFFGSILGHNIKKVFPLIASLFLFVLFANWAGLIPGVGTVGYWEHEKPVVAQIVTEQKGTTEAVARVELSKQTAEAVETKEEPTKLPLQDWHYWLFGTGVPDSLVFRPLFRGPTADINTTLALALVTMVFVQVFGLANVGVSYLSKFFTLKNPIFTFVGILELVSEISRIISFAFRLFGNIFAGEVLLAVMAFLFAFGLPMPFIALEIFVGLIQALVFAMLAAVFLNLAAAGHAESH